MDINDVAQLFHEVYLSSARRKAVAILGTHTHCHIFVLKIGEGRALTVLQYYFQLLYSTKVQHYNHHLVHHLILIQTQALQNQSHIRSD